MIGKEVVGLSVAAPAAGLAGGRISSSTMPRPIRPSRSAASWVPSITATASLRNRVAFQQHHDGAGAEQQAEIGATTACDHGHEGIGGDDRGELAGIDIGQVEGMQRAGRAHHGAADRECLHPQQQHRLAERPPRPWRRRGPRAARAQKANAPAISSSTNTIATQRHGKPSQHQVVTLRRHQVDEGPRNVGDAERAAGQPAFVQQQNADAPRRIRW